MTVQWTVRAVTGLPAGSCRRRRLRERKHCLFTCISIISGIVRIFSPPVSFADSPLIRGGLYKSDTFSTVWNGNRYAPAFLAGERKEHRLYLFLYFLIVTYTMLSHPAKKGMRHKRMPFCHSHYSCFTVLPSIRPPGTVTCSMGVFPGFSIMPMSCFTAVRPMAVACWL